MTLTSLIKLLATSTLVLAGCAIGLVTSARGALTVQVQQTNGQVLLQWQSQSNHSYRVLAADQIGQGWIAQLTNLPVMNTSPRLSYVDPVSQSSRFYRISELSK